jgi:hypothetical protein
MTVAQIRVVDAFVSGEIEDKKILEENASEIFHIRYIVTLVELTVLSSDNLEAAEILARLYGKLLLAINNSSKVWDVSVGICDSLLGFLAQLTLSGPCKPENISIVYEIGTSF